MRKKLSSIVIALGVILLIGCPVYQTIDQAIKNVEGDGVNKYGDNPVFRNILGVKSIHSDLFPGSGWCETDKYDVKTAPWMRKLFGVPDRVLSGNNCDRDNSSQKDIIIVYLCRLFIKLIPIFMIIIGILIEKKKKHTQ